MSDITTKRINILVINHDWRNIFLDSFKELRDKMERDQLRPDLNNFFFLSWSTVSYFKNRDDRFASKHMNAGLLRKAKPLLDFCSLFVIPFVMRKQTFVPDVIFIYDLGFMIPSRILKLMYDCPVVYCMTNMPEVYSKTRRLGWLKGLYSKILELCLTRMADVGYTINETMKKYLIKLGYPSKKIVVFASDTIYRDAKHIEQAQRGVVRKKYNINEKYKIILSVGRLEAEKDHQRLLNIFSKLEPSFFLIILGRGSMLDELKKLAGHLGVADRVLFPGFIHREEIWDYYKDADVFILLSKAEALGLVFWEAMYAGVPVIGSRAPGIVETIGENGLRGYLVEENETVSSIEHKISFCLGQSVERDEMVQRAQLYVEQQLSNKVSINDVINKNDSQ